MFEVVPDGDDITVTPYWSSAVGNGDDIKMNQGNLNNYSLPVVAEDGVRLYSLTTSNYGYYNMLLIPETHQYYNGGLVLHNNYEHYEGSQRVVEMMKKMFKKIRKSI